MRACDFCGTPLRRRGHGFVTAKGGISCGRSSTKRTNAEGKLVKIDLRCAKESGA